MGMAVQLTALALLNRCARGHYLIDSTAALELTLLHNFLWHWNYTWRDRRGRTTPLRAFLRFQLSNGMVSLLSNLVVMRLLVGHGHLPVLAATLISIVGSAALNYLVGNTFVFPLEGKTAKGASLMPIKSACVVLVLLFGIKAVAAQSQSSSSSLPEAPLPHPAASKTYPNETYLYHVGAFCGLGASNSQVSTTPTAGCGVGFTFVPIPLFVEVGLMGPQANRSYVSAYLSVDESIPLAHTSLTDLPMAIVGYSRLFETGHAFDYGLALATPRPGARKDRSKSLRIELRDYWTFANPNQHNVMLRVGWTAIEDD
jgi:putative flippase GtrA